MKLYLTATVVVVLNLWYVTGSLAQQPTDAELVISWNEKLLSMAENEDKFLTLKGVRTATMAHLAIHDAINSSQASYDPYSYETSSPGANQIAAATQAAFTVALNQYPDQEESLQQLNAYWLSNVPDNDAKTDGINVGKLAANAILEQRHDDGWNSEADYKWHPMAPGVYSEFNEHSGTPEGFIFGAGWAQARTFALNSQDQFRSSAPPDISSKAYVDAYNEVRELGKYKSATRTDDQSHLAMWWKDFAENAQNRLARKLVAGEELDLVSSNRLFALLNMSIFDAYVSVFDSKFHYNHWRPYTAIRWAANDGNPATDPDTTWNNAHRHTYAFPSYPSAHGTACAAAMTVFSDVFGEDYPFVMRTSQVDSAGPFSEKIAMQPPVRNFPSFADAAEECAMSRVYLGIHFRYDSLAGIKMGNKVGSQVTKNHLLPVKSGN